MRKEFLIPVRGSEESKFTKPASIPVPKKLRKEKREREREGGGKVRESIFRNSRRLQVQARVGSRGALPIKFRGLTRHRYARSTKADNSIPYIDLEKRKTIGREGKGRE